jgi:hypothetical protein
MTTFNIATDSVRDNSGHVDVSLTTDKFTALVMKYVTEHELEQTTISDAVNAVFDEHLGKRLNMPCLLTATLGVLNVQPENFGVLRDRVHKFVQNNASDKRDDNRPFRVAKGKNGGVCRWTEYVEVEKSAKK